MTEYTTSVINTDTIFIVVDDMYFLYASFVSLIHVCLFQHHLYHICSYILTVCFYLRNFCVEALYAFQELHLQVERFKSSWPHPLCHGLKAKKNMKNQWNTQTKPLGRFPFSNRLNISQSLSSNYNQLRLVPKGSVYGIVTCIYHKNQPIDGSYGIGRMLIGKARDAS